MARISGVELANNKRVVIGLQSIYGVGKTRAEKILEQAKVDQSIKISKLDDVQLEAIRRIIEKELIVEGDLRSQEQLSIKRLIDINSYRGLRHRNQLPVRGQRAQTNARTRKGKRKTVANRKKVTAK